jgi:hypothetical protein
MSMRGGDPVEFIILTMLSALVGVLGYIGAVVVVAGPWLIKPIGVMFAAFSAVTLWMLWSQRWR